MNLYSRFCRQFMAALLAAGMLIPPNPLWAQTVSQAPALPNSLSLSGAAGAKVYKIDLGNLSLANPAAVSNIAAVGSLPNVQAPSASMPKASPAAAPLRAIGAPGAAAVEDNLAAVERHPIIEVLNLLQRSGAALPETLSTQADISKLKAAAETLPAGPAKENLLAFADALSAPKGDKAAAMGKLFENSGVKAVEAGLMPAVEAPQAAGVWASIARSRLIPSGLRRYASKKAEGSRPTAAPVGEEKFRVPVENLRWTAKASDLPETTSELPITDNQVVGQDRALKSLLFGLKMKGPGYNVVVTGPEGSGRMTALRHLLGELAPKMDTPPDLVAMTNVSDNENPSILRLPSGRGPAFQAAVSQFFDNLQQALPQALNSGEIAEMKRRLKEQVEAAARGAKAELDAETEKMRLDDKGLFGAAVQVKESESGAQILIAPTYKGKTLNEEKLEALMQSGEIAQKDWKKVQESLEEKGARVLEKYKQWLIESRQKAEMAVQQIAQLEARAAAALVSKLGGDLAAFFTPGAQHNDAAHKKFQQRVRARQAALDADHGTLTIGRFSIRIAMQQTPQGFAPSAAVTLDGKPVDDEALAKMVKDGTLKQEEVDELQSALQQAAKAYVQAFKEMLEQNKMDHETLHANDPKPTPEALAGLAQLKALLTDVAASYASFLPAENAEASQDPREAYRLSVLSSNRPGHGAPVVFENSPTYENLFGAAETKGRLMSVPGVGMAQTKAPGGPALKGGSFHRANGGFLVLNLMDVMREPGAWQALSKAIRSGAAEITDGGLAGFSQRAAAYSVPSKVKVILVGSHTLKMMLEQYDEGFRAVFGAAAEFESALKISAKTIGAYLDFIRNAAARSAGEILDMTRGALAAVLEYGVKLTGANDKLSAQLGAIGALLRESSFYAKEAGRNLVEASDVAKALSERSERDGMMARRYRELFEKNVFFVATDGYVVGQVNGLALMGDFGVTARITVTAAAGAPGVVSVDQAARMTGQSFDKALATVEGFLKHTFAKTRPISASIRIAFEQNYGGIDGDSATSSKIYAALSALSGAPIYQGIAVTGSADQFGNVQAIGGVNEKITGVYELAKSRGFNGRQGVIIPASNVGELMLKPEIADAVKAGKFHIWAVEHVSQGVEILTGAAYSEILRKASLRLDDLRAGVSR